MHIELPAGAGQILSTLHEAGYEAYVVGGCVRDSLLGRTPGDWDITTSATPQQVKSCFRRTVDTGIRHGTVTVLTGGGQYEVTTYRIDGKYKDGRHPESVIFTPSLMEDLKRRDFTINAMAYSGESGVIDEFDGLGDIRRRLIRAVGNPERRFQEDALRIMRAVRFAAQLDYTIEEGTLEAIRTLAPNLRNISAERIRAELEKLLVSPHPEQLELAYRTGITGIILPELDECMKCPQHNPHHRYNVGEHIIHSVCAVRPDPVLRLAMLFHDMGKPACRTTDENGIDHFHGHAAVSADIADRVMRRLRYDNHTREAVTALVRYHDIRPANTETEIRKAVTEVGKELFPLLLEVKLADGAAQSEYRREEKQRSVEAWRCTYEKILQNRDPLCAADLAVNGTDLIREGFRPGPQIGKILNAMLEDVIVTPGHNTRAYLLEHFAR